MAIESKINILRRPRPSGDILEIASVLPIGKVAKGIKYFKYAGKWFKSENLALQFAKIETKLDKTVIKALYDSGKFGTNNQLAAALKKANQTIAGKWQAHHIIPTELLEKNDFVQDAVKQGFDFNGVINGIALDQTKHLGSHPKYTTAITNLIGDLRTKLPNASAKEILEKAAGMAKTTIEATSGKIDNIVKF